MKPLRFSLQAGQRICRASVESATHEILHQRTTPSCWKAKTAVIVDAALLLSQWNTGQVFMHSDAKWKSCIKSELIIQRIDLCEPELKLEVKKLRAGLCVNCLSHNSRPGRVGGGNAHVIEIAPSLRVCKKRPDKLHWGVNYTRRSTDVVHGCTLSILSIILLPS